MLDEDLPEWLGCPLLLGGGIGQGFLRDETVREEDVADPPLGRGVSQGKSAHAEMSRFRADRQERAGCGKATAGPTRVVSAAWLRCSLTRPREGWNAE
jgi:hypothetical protein